MILLTLLFFSFLPFRGHEDHMVKIILLLLLPYHCPASLTNANVLAIALIVLCFLVLDSH